MQRIDSFPLVLLHHLFLLSPLFSVVYCLNRVYFLVIYSHFFFSTLYAIRHNQEKNGKGLRFYRC